ncbi:hypothetical protein KHA80_02095 [Anaerobacillus sp. HL2]|nr:hypothetical protein KHA80_02095 [Anaerobacillus sp. HL2]
MARSRFLSLIIFIVAISLIIIVFIENNKNQDGELSFLNGNKEQMDKSDGPLSSNKFGLQQRNVCTRFYIAVMGRK